MPNQAVGKDVSEFEKRPPSARGGGDLRKTRPLAVISRGHRETWVRQGGEASSVSHPPFVNQDRKDGELYNTDS